MPDVLQPHQELNREFVVEFRAEDKKDRPGIFFILSGPSGAGKNTLLNLALQQVRGVYYLPSITTRAMRPGETQGSPYYFTSREEFERMIAADTFLEWKQIHTGDYYGTHLPTITHAINGGYDIITDMDVLGCVEVMKRFPRNTVSIFITTPDIEDLRRRLAGRDEAPELIERRLKRVDMEMAYADKYHYLIVNDKLNRAVGELVQVINRYMAE